MVKMYKSDDKFKRFSYSPVGFLQKTMSKTHSQFDNHFINGMDAQISFSSLIPLYIDTGYVANMDLLDLQDGSLGKYYIMNNNQKKICFFLIEEFLEPFRTSEGLYFFFSILI